MFQHVSQTYRINLRATPLTRTDAQCSGYGDGKVNGKDVPQDIYVYILTNKDTKRIGSIAVIR